MCGFQLIYQKGNNMFITLGNTLAIEKSSMGKIKKSKRSSLLSQTSCHIPYSKTHLLRSLPTTHQIWLTDLGKNISRNSRVATLQRIAIHVIVFSDCDSSSKPMFLRTSIISIHQYVFILNALLTYGVTNIYVSGGSLKVIKTWISTFIIFCFTYNYIFPRFCESDYTLKGLDLVDGHITNLK